MLQLVKQLPSGDVVQNKQLNGSAVRPACEQCVQSFLAKLGGPAFFKIIAMYQQVEKLNDPDFFSLHSVFLNTQAISHAETMVLVFCVRVCMFMGK